MKKVYHICVSAGKEVLFRCPEDYKKIIGILFFTCIKFNSKILAYAFMSNHYHLCILSPEPSSFLKSFRMRYGKYFNFKYNRKGRLGERRFFIDEIKGVEHTIAVISYILRNPVHHAISEIPFAYKYSSVSFYFRKEFCLYNNCLDVEVYGKEFLNEIEDVFEIGIVENYYRSVRSFVYYMTRLSGEEWANEQLKDKNNVPPVTLAKVENCNKYSLSELLRNEKGRYSVKKVPDLEICSFIDRYIQRKYKMYKSVYELPLQKKELLRAILSNKFYVSEEQIRRCLAFFYPD